MRAHADWITQHGDVLPKYKYADGEADVTWWPEWLAFLRRAIERGGFRVY